MITLLTDFGTSDYFVAAVKGVILAIHPNIALLDITHDIPPQDIETAAFTLGACYREFPRGTIHLAVVDPGVGSARRAVVVEAGDHWFVGPDNGVFSFVYFHEPQRRVFHITREELFRRPLSPTFHGRDLFAPIAARLSVGMSPEEVGPEIHDFIRFDLERPGVDGAGNYQGSVIHVDRFGNCVTNFTETDFGLDRVQGHARMWIAGREVSRFGSHYAAADDQRSLLAYPGSAGYWEIAVRGGSAAESTGATRGTEVRVEIK
jgi:S-adenosyl-L-methionine hydrolase (adenosine-forming)